MRIQGIICASIMACLMAVPSAKASLSLSSAADVCTFLTAAGLPTQGWKSQYPGSDEYGCNSNYKKLGNEPLANNIAYYVDGTSLGKVTQAYLVLNINSRPSAAAANQELVRDGGLLVLKITGSKIPAVIEDAIRNGKPAKVRVNQSNVEVTKQDWPTGRGYEIHFAVSE